MRHRHVFGDFSDVQVILSVFFFIELQGNRGSTKRLDFAFLLQFLDHVNAHLVHLREKSLGWRDLLNDMLWLEVIVNVVVETEIAISFFTLGGFSLTKHSPLLLFINKWSIARFSG